jgi:CubicO group peptidase (beta-lactamase class C family)
VPLNNRARTTALLLAATGFASACADAPESASEAAGVSAPTGDFRYIPEGSEVDLGVAGYAKVMCSAVFVSGRDPEEAVHSSGYFMMPATELGGVSRPIIDREESTVSLSYGDDITRTAVYTGGQGCVLLPEGETAPFFTPVAVTTTLPPAETMSWPMGDAPVEEPFPADVSRDLVEEAVDLAFSDADAYTAAFLVLHRGQIIAERYMPGIDKDTQLESWSMGKSLTATMIGQLILEGEFALDDPAPVPEWHADPSDPRAEIRVSDLMRMSSGLRFIAPRDPDFGPESGYPDHMFVYTGAVDIFDFSVNRPLQFPPNTEGRYRNSDPLSLGYIIKRTVEGRGEEYLTYPQRALFDKIGIRKQVLETDPYGNFQLTGYDYGTARNWARIALLYLQDGVWNGERLLPEGFVDFVSTPAPAWSRPEYGGQFWVNGVGAMPVPETAYYAAGGGGQRTIIVPTHDLAVVRLGHFRGSEPGMRTLNDALAKLMEAVPPVGVTR